MQKCTVRSIFWQFISSCNTIGTSIGVSEPLHVHMQVNTWKEEPSHQMILVDNDSEGAILVEQIQGTNDNKKSLDINFDNSQHVHVQLTLITGDRHHMCCNFA